MCSPWCFRKLMWKWGQKKTESEFWLQEQARKALEGALSGKKNEYVKWDKEIKRREELGGGGDTGGGGWFGWGGRFGWSNDDNFWQESKQASFTILGIILMVRNFFIPLSKFFCWYSHDQYHTIKTLFFLSLFISVSPSCKRWFDPCRHLQSVAVYTADSEKWIWLYNIKSLEENYH